MMLTDKHTSRNILLQCMILQQCYQNRGGELNDHVVMGDETWILYSDIEMKHQKYIFKEGMKKLVQ